MSKVWVTADWHLGHKRISRFRKQVSSTEENTRILLENYKNLIKKRDVVWFLGDMVFDYELCSLIKELPGIKKFVIGNHDFQGKNILVAWDTFDEVYGMVKYKKAWLTHAPIHPNELRGRINIHGHVHEATIDDKRYVNVCVDQTDMKPVLYQNIIARMPSEFFA